MSWLCLSLQTCVRLDSDDIILGKCAAKQQRATTRFAAGFDDIVFETDSEGKEHTL